MISKMKRIVAEIDADTRNIGVASDRNIKNARRGDKKMFKKTERFIMETHVGIERLYEELVRVAVSIPWVKRKGMGMPTTPVECAEWVRRQGGSADILPGGPLKSSGFLGD